MRHFFAALIIFIVCGFMISCSSAENEMKQHVTELTNSIDSYLSKIKSAVDILGKKVQDEYDKYDSYDLAIEGMDIQEGGKYAVYDETMYYKEVDDGGIGIHITGFVPINDELKQKIRLYEKFEDDLKNTKLANDDIIATWTISYDGAVAFFPYKQFIGVLPKGLDVRPNIWFTSAFDESNVNKETVWTKEPFRHLALTIGWNLTASYPIYFNDEEEGIVTADTPLQNLVDNIKISENNQMVAILSQSLYVLAASPSAIEKLNLKAIGDIEYLDSYSFSHLPEENFKLNHADQGKELNKLGGMIATGERNFELTINGTNYVVAIEIVPHINYFVVGFVKK